MKKYEGLHFYINIVNFDNIVLDEEKRTGAVTHSIHELDTYFSCIEAFGKKHYGTIFHVEKVTGARLHMYVLDNIENAFPVVAEISGYANQLSSYLNREVSKYKTLINFSIQIGACYGKFYDFTFTAEDMDEETSIGYAANYAAKLQGLTRPAYISISSDIYESLDEDYKRDFEIINSDKIQKYDQKYYASTLINKLRRRIDVTKELEYARSYANRLNLTAINFSEARQIVDFSNLSKKNCKKLYGIPLFSDVRGFTEQFEEDDSNLEQMAIKTQNILTSMYVTVKNNHGVHIQFQGDREEALFHNYGNYNCIVDAVQTGLRIIDKVQEYEVTVGIGESIGNLFATKIGARGEKDNLLLGSIVTQADHYEDEFAGKNQLVVSREIYEYLKNNKPLWAENFEKIKDQEAYRTRVGYRELLRQSEQKKLIINTHQNNYNGAWRGYTEVV